MNTYRVDIKKRRPIVEPNVVYFIEAGDAREAFRKVDGHTGTYKCDSIEVVEVDGKVYHK